MTIIETKADALMNLVRKEKSIKAKKAAEKLDVEKAYVRKLAYVLHKRGMLDLKTNYLTLTLIDKDENVFDKD